MRRITALLLMLLLLPGLVAAEDDFDLDDILSDADPDVVKNTYSQPGNADDILLDENNEPVSIYEEDGSILITLTATGDFTVGGDSRKSTNIWMNELKKHDNDYNFALANVRDIFLADDLTIVNFEGTLTDSTYVPSEKRNNEFLFSASPDHVSMLVDNGIEAVALENNHVLDHGQAVYEETQQHLEDAGIVWSNSTHVGVMEVKGIQIAMLSYLCIDRYNTLWDQVPKDIAAAKEQYPIVIVSFHWGKEMAYSPTQNQIKMGRLAVDSGADLVLGHHSHRMNPIEYYNGVYICYSLGNFCFGGNRKAYQENKNRTPAVQDAAPALMLRAVLTFDDDGTYKGQQITLYPVQTTGIDRAAGDTVQVNNYQPKFITGPLAAHVLHLMQIDMNYDASKTPKYSNAESINKALRALVIAREEELAAMDSSEGMEALTLPFLPAEAE